MDVAENKSAGWERRVLPALVALGVALPLLYAGLVGHVWEDYLITFRHSENWAAGNGLTYNLGGRVHGFTSPLGVLLPGIFHWMMGQPQGYGPALGAFRVASALAFAGAVGLMFLAVRRATGLAAAGAVTAALVLLDPKSVEFSMNGQETAFMLLFIAGGICLSLEPVSRRWKWWGVVIAGLQWTRPDGVLFSAALLAGNFLFTLEPRRVAIVAMGKAVALSLAIYAPWLIWTTWYYGSPIPHTIIAKMHRQDATHEPGVINRAVYTLHAAAAVFGQIYYPAPHWPWHVWLTNAALALGALVSGVVGLARREKTRVAGGSSVEGTSRPRFSAAGRMACLMTLCFAALVAYYAWIPLLYPWYLPPGAMFGFASLGVLAGFVIGHGGIVRKTAIFVAAIVLLERGLFLISTGKQMATQQRLIENDVRGAAGRFIRENRQPGDTVLLEPLGYIGYEAGVKMYDYPGLVAPEVTNLLRNGSTFAQLVEGLQPTWVVLRPSEVRLVKSLPSFDARYQLMRIFDTASEVDAAHVYGASILKFDATFAVYRRRPDPPK